MTQENITEVNFKLKGFTSVLIGVYIILAAQIINSMLSGFLVDDNPMGMLSVQLLEGFIFGLVVLFFILATLALFFKGRRVAKKNDITLWNTKTKRIAVFYGLSFTTLFVILFSFSSLGKIDLITPLFLVIYGLTLVVMREKSKSLLIITLVSVLLGIVTFVIPSYWFSALFILGMAHITYGIAVK